MAGERLDRELVRRKLMPSQSAARLAIRDGKVSVAGRPATRPGHRVAADVEIDLAPGTGSFVSRGAEKLVAALEAFPVAVEGRRAIDVGSSTGGFTQCLLQRGAAQVVAVDVGSEQLHETLRRDPRVRVHEGVNIRYADPQELGSPLDVIVVDLSFISVRLVASKLASLGGESSDWVILVKPQFELSAADLGKGGVVRNSEARSRAVVAVTSTLSEHGLTVRGAIASPITGGSGNKEALLWLRRKGMAIGLEELYKVLDDE